MGCCGWLVSVWAGRGAYIMLFEVGCTLTGAVDHTLAVGVGCSLTRGWGGGRGVLFGVWGWLHFGWWDCMHSDRLGWLPLSLWDWLHFGC